MNVAVKPVFFQTSYKSLLNFKMSHVVFSTLDIWCLEGSFWSPFTKVATEKGLLGRGLKSLINDENIV